jgi:hypothetical protein
VHHVMDFVQSSNFPTNVALLNELFEKYRTRSCGKLFTNPKSIVPFESNLCSCAHVIGRNRFSDLSSPKKILIYQNRKALRESQNNAKTLKDWENLCKSAFASFVL